MGRELVKDETILRKPSKQVSKKKGLEIGRELFKFLRQWNKDNLRRQGIGLSAPQIGIDARVCVIDVPNLQLVLVNPVIIGQSESKISCTEGCLSFPGKSVVTERRLWVEVSADNIQPRIFGVDLSRVTGKPYERAVLEGICVQHELDHLEGILIMDRAAS
jgi:peptide deformylase